MTNHPRSCHVVSSALSSIASRAICAFVAFLCLSVHISSSAPPTPIPLEPRSKLPADATTNNSLTSPSTINAESLLFGLPASVASGPVPVPGVSEDAMSAAKNSPQPVPVDSGTIPVENKRIDGTASKDGTPLTASTASNGTLLQIIKSTIAGLNLIHPNETTSITTQTTITTSSTTQTTLISNTASTTTITTEKKEVDAAEGKQMPAPDVKAAPESKAKASETAAKLPVSDDFDAELKNEPRDEANKGRGGGADEEGEEENMDTEDSPLAGGSIPNERERAQKPIKHEEKFVGGSANERKKPTNEEEHNVLGYLVMFLFGSVVLLLFWRRRQRILAYIVEGRRTNGRRRTNGASAQYRKLKTGEDDE
ncbi:hypothetical protein RvY_08737 [Ramazzottius varieornatus]|uniref:Uncharacterized protein n=1 Tax=Ramazzottius varieornatus TaxID=947166 RepID=A0A1D1VG40_RAMVA|nr:hypothetical protein RvY_08737 [Ramazzottius varieornatus]